jgi:hypothetical protein
MLRISADAAASVLSSAAANDDCNDFENAPGL